MVEKNIQNTQKQKRSKKRLILVIVFLILFLISTYISYRGSYLEFKEIGEEYLDILKVNLKYQYIITGINFAIIFISIYLTNRTIKKGLTSFFEEEKREVPKLPNKSIAFIGAILISLFTSGIFMQKVMQFTNVAFFGIDDPVFNTDVGFYIFQKPLIELVLVYLLMLVIALTIYIAVYCIIVFNLQFDGINPETLKNSKLMKKVLSNIMKIAILIAVLTAINIQGVSTQEFISLNDEESTKIVGAGITDVTIKVWGYRILAIVIIVSIFIAIKAFKNKNTKKVIISLLSVPAYLVLLFIVMLGFQLLYVNSNELDKQKKYIENNISFTKRAYNIEIDELDLETSETMSLSEMQKSENVINNIPIVSSDITLKTLTNLQTNKGYYSYKNQRISKYLVEGREQLVYFSPREITNQSSSYNNKTYEYTHGYGAVVTSATETLEDGNIKYIQKDFVSENSEINIQNPRIYYGLETNDTIVTNTKNKSEFDYPTNTAQNAEYVYDGNSGLNLNFIDRLILAIKEKDVKLALSTNVNNNSKILINRNIIQRAKKIMPYLLYDENPYLVADDVGNLVWVIDAYTISNQYPYSQKTTIEHEGSKHEINYIRNSVKVLINSYDGQIDFYITDKTDPIAMSYYKIYPTLFKESEGIPQDIAKHFIYPEFLYNIQSTMLTMYHNVSADVLYRGNDIWSIATYSANTTKGTKMSPYYTMLKTIDSDESYLGLVLPYTPYNKQNMNAYLVGNSEGNDTKLTLYKFSTDSNILGTMQLDKQLEQDETISKEIANINVTGTRLIRNMLIVPIDNTILYIEPIFQQTLNETNSIPILKKVIVASGNKVAIGDNLKEALLNLVSSQYAVNITVENTDTIEDLVEAIIKANNNLEESENAKDWEQMGKDISRLKTLIKQLDDLKKKQDKEDKKQVNNQTNTIGNVVNKIENNV